LLIFPSPRTETGEKSTMRYKHIAHLMYQLVYLSGFENIPHNSVCY
jgi:hypothetical protein